MESLLFGLQILSLVLLLAGLILMVRSRKYRTAEAPRLSWAALFNPKNWLPFWKTKHWYTPGGYKMYFYGIILVELGAIAFLVTGYLEKGHILGIHF